MLANLSGAMIFVLLIYVVVRLVDLVLRGRLGLMFSEGVYSFMFWVEIALFLVPAFMLMSEKGRYQIGNLFRAAILIALAGSVYRFDTYLVAFKPGPGWSYFPSIPEIMISVGLVALEILVYLWLVKKFPVLSGTKPHAAKA
jgi:Ni/Fe-hydrogenase subunit HybB-like protein